MKGSSLSRSSSTASSERSLREEGLVASRTSAKGRFDEGARFADTTDAIQSKATITAARVMYEDGLVVVEEVGC